MCGVVTPAEAKAIRKLKLPELFLKMRAMGDDFDHTVGALYAHLDRQLLKEYGLACEYGNHIHAFARAFLFAGQWKRERLWAAPGMMDYFLWKHKLYSPFVRAPSLSSSLSLTLTFGCLLCSFPTLLLQFDNCPQSAPLLQRLGGM